MRRTARVLLLWIVFGSATAGATVTEDTSITIRLFNRSRVANAVVLEGEKESQDLLQRAGIGVAWLNCPGRPECAEVPSPTSLIVTLLRRGSALASVDVLGLALEDAGGSGTYAYIFENRLNEIAGQTHLATSRLLAYAIAHEIGHLLKGGHSHSAKGIMSAVWLKPELDEIARAALAFTANDAEIMRSRLSRTKDTRQRVESLVTMK